MTNITPMTRAKFDALPPKEQGYFSYMQAAWNKNIPDSNPHEPSSTEGILWSEGRMAACINAQDFED